MMRSPTRLAGCMLAVAAATFSVAAEPSAPAGKPIDAGPIKLEENLIMGGYTYAYGIAAADLDADGDLDITSADALPNNSLYWFANDGQGKFARHFIQKDDPQRLERHAIGDVDGDGRPDVVIVKNLHGDLLWFANRGAPADGMPWQRNVITKGKLPGAYDVALADLDRDGDLDVAASSWTGKQFAWFENDGTPADGEWTKHLIEEDVGETRAILASDLDGDGDLDLVGTARTTNLVVWYENNGHPAASEWKRHVIDREAYLPTHGQTVDLDQDGDVDVLMALGMVGSAEQSAIVWYENSGRPADPNWTRHTIIQPFPQAFEAVAGDLDGDGDLDVVATGWRVPGQVAWFENTGDAKVAWKPYPIKTDWINANQVILADFDGSGTLDIAACAERGSLELRWWRNLGRR